MAKRTGLGRGIGSLIPVQDNPTQARPVDVFFPYNEVPHAEGTAGASPVGGSAASTATEIAVAADPPTGEAPAVPSACGTSL